MLALLLLFGLLLLLLSYYCYWGAVWHGRDKPGRVTRRFRARARQLVETRTANPELRIHGTRNPESRFGWNPIRL